MTETMNDEEYEEYKESITLDEYQPVEVKVGGTVIGRMVARYSQDKIDDICRFIYQSLKSMVDGSIDKDNLTMKMEDLRDNYPYIEYNQLLELFLKDLEDNFDAYETSRYTVEDWKERKELLEKIKEDPYYSTETRKPSILQNAEKDTIMRYVEDMSNEELKAHMGIKTKTRRSK